MISMIHRKPTQTFILNAINRCPALFLQFNFSHHNKELFYSTKKKTFVLFVKRFLIVTTCLGMFNIQK